MNSSTRDVVLIISASGRALAASARGVDIPVVVLDLFNDLDTRALARASASCANTRGGFSKAKLLEAIERFRPPADYAACVVGSGLESRPGVLRALAGAVDYAGNDAACIAASKDPRQFFALLDDLEIAHPEVRFTVPDDLRGWLSKRVGGAGGMHVRHASGGWPLREKRYFQRYENGRVMSALFLADGVRALMVGCSEQWAQVLSPRIVFAYGGAVSADADEDSPEGSALRRRLTGIIGRLTPALGLCGLNGLDFIMREDQPMIIELNPRPTATLDLHDARVPGGLLHAHLRACAGVLPTTLRPPDRAHAHAVLWAPAALHVGAQTRWPDWVTDIPAPGMFIPARRPICSVHAAGSGATEAKFQLARRMRMLLSSLWQAAA